MHVTTKLTMHVNWHPGQRLDLCSQPLQASLERLQIPKLALYQIHFPAAFLNGFANTAFVRGLAHCQQIGLTDAVGVSNFNEQRLREAHQTLQVTHTATFVGYNISQLYSWFARRPDRCHRFCHEVALACTHTKATTMPKCQSLNASDDCVGKQTFAWCLAPAPRFRCKSTAFVKTMSHAVAVATACVHADVSQLHASSCAVHTASDKKMYAHRQSTGTICLYLRMQSGTCDLPCTCLGSKSFALP